MLWDSILYLFQCMCGYLCYLQIDEQFSVMMDSLAVEAATGVHSTKKERSVDTAV